MSLFADYRFDDAVETAATDGKTIWISPTTAVDLPRDAFGGLLVHELLHCALDHVARRGARDPFLWNIAADIVVNGMIRSAGKFALPAGSVQDRTLENLSVEEVYEQVEREGVKTDSLTLIDVRPRGPNDGDPTTAGKGTANPWRNALEQALAVARRRDPEFGDRAWTGHRELARLHQPQLSWTELLWQFATRTPTDFVGFDRRFLWRGLYLDAMDGETVRLKVAIDTSGSVSANDLSRFMSELLAILRAYPHVQSECYFADAILYGPYPLDDEIVDRRPEGGGGTSFEPFFDSVRTSSDGADLLIYFTDGYGSFPSAAPDTSVLWVVVPGGWETIAFPFGDVARMAG